MSTDREEVTELVGKLKEGMTVDNSKGTFEVPKNLFTEGSPVSLEDMKALQRYTADFIAAAHVAVGETCTSAAVKDKDLAVVEGKIPMVGHDSLKLRWERESTFNQRNPSTGETKEVTNYGVTSGRLVINAARNSAGNLSEIRAELQANAKAALAKAMG